MTTESQPIISKGDKNVEAAVIWSEENSEGASERAGRVEVACRDVLAA